MSVTIKVNRDENTLRVERRQRNITVKRVGPRGFQGPIGETPNVPDATSTTKGKVKLAGDLGGTADLPTVPALATKADADDLATHIADTSNPHAVTKAQVGLSNVDNTSDANKPVSTATQTALSGKVSKAGDTMAGDLSMGGNSLTNVPVLKGPSGESIEFQNASSVPVFTVSDDGDIITRETLRYNDLRYGMAFAGTASSHVALGQVNYIDNSAWTFGGWFESYSTSMSADGALFSYGFNQGANRGYVLRLDGSTRRFQLFAGNQTFTIPDLYLLPYERVHLVFKYDGSSILTVKRHGELVATVSGVLPKVADPAVQSYLASRDNGGRYFHGAMDTPFLYPRLTTDEEDYRVEHETVYPSGARFIYPMNERSGSQVTDSSGSGNHGTNVGGTWITSPMGTVTHQPPTPARFQAQLVNAHDRVASIVEIGSSTPAGSNASNVARRSVTVLGKILQHAFNSTGVGGFWTRASDWSFSNPNTFNESLTGLALSSATLASAQTMTYTANCTGAEIHYARGTGSSNFTYTIDGGSPVTVTVSTSGAAGTHDGIHQSATLPAGNHTFVITGPALINGVYINYGDRSAGVRSYNGGHGGYNSGNFSGSGGDSSWTRINAIAPSLIIISPTSNDFISSFDPATTAANVETMIRTIRLNVTSNPDILIVQQHKRLDAVSVTTDPTYTYADYAAPLQAVARRHERVYFTDLSPYGPFTNDAAHDPENLLDTDSVHLRDPGHRLRAYLLAAKLAEGVTPASTNDSSRTWNTQATFAGLGSGTNGSVITNALTVFPNPGIGGSASVFLNNNGLTAPVVAQIWEFFCNDQGQFGVFDKTNSLQPITISPNTPSSALSLSSSGAIFGLKLDVNSDSMRLRTAKTPSSATATGSTGDICWDANYLYVCIATNTWRRIAHASW